MIVQLSSKSRCLFQVSLFLFILELALFVGRRVLVLLIFRHQVVHVRLSLSEFHLVHALASVPMEESLATEHSCELLGNSLEQLLDGGAVSDEGGRHLEASWRDVADGRLDVVGDPFDEVAAVLVLHVEHLLVDLLHGHAATEHGCNREVAAVTWVASSHHVLGIEHLLGELGHRQGAVLLAASGRERGEAGHEEVETREWHHVDSQLPQIGVQLAGEAQAGGHTRHRGRHQMVQVAVCRGGELQCTEADIVQSFIVNAVGLVGVLNKLMDGQGGVVGLNNGVRHLNYESGLR